MLPTSIPAANSSQVAVMNGTKLYVVNRKDGKVAWEKFAAHPPGGGPGMSEDFIFVPMINGIVESSQLEKFTRPGVSFRSHGRIMTQPVVFRDAVAWTTDMGNVYVGNSEVRGVRFRVSSRDHQIGNKLLTPPSSSFTPGAPTFLSKGPKKPAQLYFASAEGYVYCCDADRGSVLARFSAGEPISHSPVVVRENLFVISEFGNLYCMDSDTLMEKWLVPVYG